MPEDYGELEEDKQVRVRACQACTTSLINQWTIHQRDQVPLEDRNYVTESPLGNLILLDHISEKIHNILFQVQDLSPPEEQVRVRQPRPAYVLTRAAPPTSRVQVDLDPTPFSWWTSKRPRLDLARTRRVPKYR